MGNGSRSKAVALLAIVLVAGTALGWFAAEETRHERRKHRRGTDYLVGRMTRDFDLTSVQQDSVRAIMNRRRVDIDSLWADVRPRFDAIRSLTNAQIEAQLTPEQQVKFREDVKKREERRRERDKARGPR